MVTRRMIGAAVLTVGLAIASAYTALAQPGPAQPGPAQPGQVPPGSGQPESALSVMSFNIRYGTANDGDNHWEKRRDLLIGLLRGQQADIVGVQEALHFQLQEILQALPDYRMVGIGRSDGKTAGEYSAILYRASRLTVTSSDTFWFSDTPGQIASRSWGNTIERICTWARFEDRQGLGLASPRPPSAADPSSGSSVAGASTFYVFNVHLDHQSQPSRERSAALLRERIAAREGQGEPVIVTGDFNAGETNPAVVAMRGEGAMRFVDTFRVLHPDEAEVGTFTGFKTGNTKGPKIDYIFVEPTTKVLAAEILRTSGDGRYPSDHFPVTARVQFAAAR